MSFIELGYVFQYYQMRK